MIELDARGVFKLLSEKLGAYEYLLFSWNGGGDDFGGYKFLEGKRDGVKAQQKPPELTDDILEAMACSTLLEDINISVGCVDSHYSNGVLLVALSALSEDFEYCGDSIPVLYKEASFKGFALTGMNYEELDSSCEL